MTQSKNITIFFDCENISVEYLQDIYDEEELEKEK